MAIEKADAMGNKDSTLNKYEPGWMIIKTPINPNVTANNLLTPNFSPRIGTASKVAIIGPLCAKAVFSESIKNFNPKK